MDGKYLATNFEPFKSIGNGAVFNKLSSFLEEKNSHRSDENKGSLVAYQVRGSEYVVSVYCLIENGNGLSFRYFDYHKSVDEVVDGLEKSAAFGFGIHYSYMEYFFELREFYLDNRDCDHKETETIEIPGTNETCTICHDCNCEV